MIYRKAPDNFIPKFEIAIGILEVGGEVLLMKRGEHDEGGGKWDIPGGGLDDGEDALAAFTREFQEETGIVPAPGEAKFVGKFFVRTDRDFVMNLFYLSRAERPEVVMDPGEHQDYRWVRPEDAAELDLLPDGHKTLGLIMKLQSAFKKS